MRILAVLVLALCVLAPATVRANALDDAFAGLPTPPAQTPVRLITDNHEAWYARWYVVEAAKKSIDCTYFTVVSDTVGESLIGMLLKKAREGVKIRLMVDSRGSLGLSVSPLAKDYLPALVHFPNVEVRRYNAFKAQIEHLPSSIKSGIASSHSKMLIVDGEWVVAGGRNMADHWFTAVQDDPLSFHDIDFLAHGTEIGAQAKRAFEDEFNALTSLPVKPHSDAAFEKASAFLEKVRRNTEGLMNGTVVPGAASTELLKFASMNRYASFKPFPDDATAPLALLGKHSAANPIRNPITDSLLSLINAAQTELTIAHAYMVLTDRVKAALIAAGKRGVKIQYMTNSPESSESFLTQARFVKEWPTYLRDIPNLRIIALAANRKLHGKIIVVDGRVSILGSYNMDPMSETINAEDAAVVKSETFAGNAIAWMNEIRSEGIEYKIRVEADGKITQLVGPSDHCKKSTLAILKIISWFDFLRPLI